MMSVDNRIAAGPDDLPIAIIGAGPIGLAMAAHLVGCDKRFIIFEAGPEAGHAIRQWQHVRLFTEWASNIDTEAERLLLGAGWRPPAGAAIPTSGELLDDYLAALSALPAIEPHLRLGHRVIAVTRHGLDKVKTEKRAERPFLLQIQTVKGEKLVEACAIVDASGTWFTNNPLLSSGIWTDSERAAAAYIRYGLPDVLGPERERYAGRTTAVVGSGYSAINVILDLAELRVAQPKTGIKWIVRRESVDSVLNGTGQDLLLAQGWLGQRLRAFVARGDVEVATSFRVSEIRTLPDHAVLVDADGRLLEADMLVAATGFRPDLSLFRELRADIEPSSEAVRGLGALIDPNLHSCYTVPIHGLAELTHPEPNFYVIGMKSYGRAPTFLLKTGYEQARAIAAAVCDTAATRRAVSVCAAE
jgi:2-polyprenyl-6-methoxyphenol hydroxylase-like FAD-dependent oxidoreductase